VVFSIDIQEHPPHALAVLLASRRSLLNHALLFYGMQFMLWWSGLRGAMAFSLGNLAADKFGEDGQVMRTCVFYLVSVRGNNVTQEELDGVPMCAVCIT